MARRSTFNQTLADRILDAVCEGASLTEASAACDVPRQTVRSWLDREPAFSSAFEAAKLVRVEALADQINILANSAQQVASDAVKNGENPNAAIAALRVTCENKRWLLAKLDSRQFGDKVVNEITGKDGAPLIPEPDIAKTALGLLGAVHEILRSRNPETPSSARAELPPPGVRTLLSGAPAPAEPAPVPVKKLDQEALDPAREYVGSHPVLDRNGRKTHPVFDTASGRVLRFVTGTGEQAR